MRVYKIVATFFVSACAVSDQSDTSPEPIPVLPHDVVEYHLPDDVVEYHRQAWEQFDWAASSFDVADGVDRSEAEFLGGAYFFWRLGPCGFPDEPQDAGAEWHMRPRVGYSGKPAADLIRVDKRSGVVSYASEPSIDARGLIQIERERLRQNLRTFVDRSSQGK
jgi:hypothetical protein